MSKLLLLYCTFLVSVVFLILPDTLEPYDYFLFSDMKLHFATYAYFISEKFILIILAYIIANESTEYKVALWVFFVLIVMDLVDFLIAYNSVWFHLNGFPVSINTLKVGIFGLAILYEWINRIGK